MSQFSNDEFGIVRFTDSNGVIKFLRADAKNGTEKISALTVTTCVANWTTHPEFKRHGFTITGTGNGEGKR